MHAAITGGVHTVARRAAFESAVAQPMQTWGGEFLYGTPYLMAAALLRSLSQNQSFTDGNKRIAWAAAAVFLELNGITVEANPEAVVEMMLDVTKKKADVKEIAEFLERYTTEVTASARALLDRPKDVPQDAVGEGAQRAVRYLRMHQEWSGEPEEFFRG